MHRCQVKMRYDHDTPEENLIACGDHANKKIGNVWMCDFHYTTYANSPRLADGSWNLQNATDARDQRLNFRSITGI